jgi:streptomycin 6-kinase
MDSVAFETSSIDAYPTKDRWDATAAELVATMLDRWHLTAGAAYVGGEAASVLRVTTRDGRPAVLKVGFPHVEAVWEAVALESWGPTLAPTVLRQDPWTWSLLLEAVEPGIPLSKHELRPTEALTIAAELYRDISSRPAPAGVVTLAEIMGDYLATAHAHLPGQHAALAGLDVLPLLERGLAVAADLADTDGAGFFLHGDYNPGNVLEGDGRWVVIDPNPMLGDREFDLFPLVEQLNSPWTKPRPADHLVAELQLVSDIIGTDVARAVRWAFARCALNVSWYLEDGNQAALHSTVRELRVWADLIAP